MSGWKRWEDEDRTLHLVVTLNDLDARHMDRVQLAMLADAGRLIELAFDPETPGQLADLRAQKVAARDRGRERDLRC